MIVLDRPDINDALQLLAQRQMLADEPDPAETPTAIPDEKFLSCMKVFKVPESDLELVKEAHQQVIDLLTYTKWNTAKAISLVAQAEVSRREKNDS